MPNDQLLPINNVAEPHHFEIARDGLDRKGKPVIRTLSPNAQSALICWLRQPHGRSRMMRSQYQDSFLTTMFYFVAGKLEIPYYG